MNDWLVTWGLLGTAKKPEPPPLADELAAALAAREGLEPEQRLLLAAGAHHLYGEAGQVPPRVELVAPPEDARPAPSARAARVLEEILTRRTALLLEALARLDRAGLRWPASSLPDLLNRGRQQFAEIPLEQLARVVDARGLWLASFNPAWSWLREAQPAGDDRQIWENGPKAQRFVALRRVRERDPALARDWLMESFKSEKADQRLEGLQTLAEQLGPDDEPFLETCLQDRSSAVRSAAALLLLRLPESAWCARSRERAAPLITLPEKAKGWLDGLRGLVGAGAAPTLEINPPEAADPAWESEGLLLKPPTGIGARAFLLCELLAHVPPVFFRERLNMTAEQLVAAVRGNEWEESILVGWGRAAAAVGDGAMAEALLPRLFSDFVQKNLYVAVSRMAATPSGLCLHLFQQLPLESRVGWLIQFLENRCPINLFEALAGLPILPLDLSARFVTAAQAAAQRVATHPKFGHNSPFTLLHLAARFLSPELGPITWPSDSTASPHYTLIIEQFTEIFEARRRLAEEIPL